jgi:hypothetical protein
MAEEVSSKRWIVFASSRLRSGWIATPRTHNPVMMFFKLPHKKASLSEKITDFELERVRAEAFASIPTERQVLDLICRTVADVKRACLEWLASFVDGDRANVTLSRA